MNKQFLTSILAFLIGSSAYSQILTSFGTNNFTPDPGSTAPFTQSATSLTFNGTLALSDSVFGGFDTTYDWSSYSTLGVEFSVSGTNPDLPASIDFFDSGFAVANTYTFTTVGVGAVPSVVSLVLDTPGTGNMNDIIGFALNWNGAGSINSTFTNFVAVPEPATWALLAGSLTTIVILRRRRRA